MRLGLGLGLSRQMGVGGGVTVVSDLFTRADSEVTMGTSTSGHVWAPQTETWGIGTNRGKLVTAVGRGFTVVTAAGTANSTVAVTLTTIFLSDAAGLWVRSTDGNNGFWAVANTTLYQLFRREAGANTSLGTGGSTPADGDIISIVMSGSSLIVKVNAITVISTTDAFNATATKHGLTAASPGHRFDNFTVVT